MARTDIVADAARAVDASQEPLDTLRLRSRSIDVRRILAVLDILRRVRHQQAESLTNLEFRRRQFADDQPHDGPLAPGRHRLDHGPDLRFGGQMQRNFGAGLE